MNNIFWLLQSLPRTARNQISLLQPRTNRHPSASRQGPQGTSPTPRGRASIHLSSLQSPAGFPSSLRVLLARSKCGNGKREHFKTLVINTRNGPLLLRNGNVVFKSKRPFHLKSLLLPFILKIKVGLLSRILPSVTDGSRTEGAGIGQRKTAPHDRQCLHAEAAAATRKVCKTTTTTTKRQERTTLDLWRGCGEVAVGTSLRWPHSSSTRQPEPRRSCSGKTKVEESIVCYFLED